MWTYHITAGLMVGENLRDTYQGYSGAGHIRSEGRNNPDMQGVVGKGPVPVGDYDIRPPRHSIKTGPYTLDLVPRPGTDTHGRSLFRIHGNNAENDASHGCVILPPNARRAVWESGDHMLRVVI